MKKLDKFVAFAHTCIGTPFHHQARVPNVGLDCAGLVVVSALAAGIRIKDESNYPHIPDGSFIERVKEHATTIEFKDLKKGDLCMFRFEKDPQHIAIISSTEPLMMIHAWAQARKVVENSLDDYWKSKLAGCFRLKGFK